MAKVDHEICEETCQGSADELHKVEDLLLDESDAVELADFFKALGDPTRVKMIHALQKSEMCVHDLTEVLKMNQSAVSHQLRFLRNTRIVKRRKVGRTVFYSLDDNHIEQIFSQTLQHLKHR
ncbi:ArsR/SmtB family transcription factor [Paenibacillus senegalensis]|uniref:ArsR/SmtB family transcription factor n=1 Tax=Paenibacillus senegalensis TaxID=1465766 RepID=UPI0002886076|nr:metalloregulator ArsR/SmtB family transcription factor [Paenibacillus senegalensis]